MKWLDRLMGTDRVPEHVQRALDTAEAADEAATEAQGASSRYWRARRANDDANRVILDEYLAAERLRAHVKP